MYYFQIQLNFQFESTSKNIFIIQLSPQITNLQVDALYSTTPLRGVPIFHYNQNIYS